MNDLPKHQTRAKMFLIASYHYFFLKLLTKSKDFNS